MLGILIVLSASAVFPAPPAATGQPALPPLPEHVPEHVIEGSLFIDGTREPLSGFRVFALLKWDDLGQAVTDQAGRFTIGPFQADPGDVRIFASSPYDIYSVKDETVSLLPDGGEVTVDLFATCVFPAPYAKNLVLEGNVFQWDGKTPLVLGFLEVERGEHVIGRTRTDARGFFRFRFQDLPPGTYDLAVKTGNDLLAETSLAVELGARDHRERSTVVLESPVPVLLRRVTIIGLAQPRHAPGMMSAGAEVRFVTGTYLLGEGTVGAEGQFQVENFYAPPGPLVTEVIPRLGLLQPGRVTSVVPAEGNSVEVLHPTVPLRPTGRWWAFLVFTPVALVFGFWVILRVWILPEWRGVRRAVSEALSRPPPRTQSKPPGQSG